jgi:hypothetical protein
MSDKGTIRKTVKLVRHDDYLVEVPVELIEDDTGWSPYLSAEDGLRLDAARLALRPRRIMPEAVRVMWTIVPSPKGGGATV